MENLPPLCPFLCAGGAALSPALCPLWLPGLPGAVVSAAQGLGPAEPSSPARRVSGEAPCKHARSWAEKALSGLVNRTLGLIPATIPFQKPIPSALLP